MGLFSCFSKKSNSDGELPIGMALDLLENASRRFPYLVLEWIEANPARAQKIEGLVDPKTCKQFKRWDGPYSITIKRGDGVSRVVNMFFQNLRRDAKIVHDKVVEAGENENKVLSWIVNSQHQFSREAIANEVVKRGVRPDIGSALEYVKDVIGGDAAGLFQDLHEGYGTEDKANAVGVAVADGLRRYTTALSKDASFSERMDKIEVGLGEAKTLMAANLYAYATTMLSTYDICDRIAEFKERLYSELRDDFPNLRSEFNMVLNAYEQTDQAILEKITEEIPQAEKMEAAFLLVTGSLLTARLWGEAQVSGHQDFLCRYGRVAKEFYQWMKANV